MAEDGKSDSPLLIGVALVGAPVFLVVLLLLVLGGGATPPPSPCGAGGSSPGVGTLKVAGIPAAYVPIIQKAGTVCPEFPPPVLAAQLDQESGFSDPTSSTGAQGPAQFEPATWITWGNGDNVHDPVAAIDAQARFDCALAGQVKQTQAAGQIHSSASVTEMALGAYNAGFGAVLASGGIPQNSQTMAYVPRIMTLARTTFSDAGTITAPGGSAAPPADAGGTGTQAAAGGCGGVGGQVAVHQVAGGGGGPVAQLAVAAAKTQLGATYIWGGGDQNGPTGGGFDCSGLVLYAYHHAGSDALHGARTAQTQYAATAGARLSGGFDPASYQPGDLLFYGTADNIHHVAMAIGGGQLIQASTFGEPLNIKPIYHSDFFAATRPLDTPAGAPQ